MHSLEILTTPPDCFTSGSPFDERGPRVKFPSPRVHFGLEVSGGGGNPYYLPHWSVNENEAYEAAAKLNANPPKYVKGVVTASYLSFGQEYRLMDSIITEDISFTVHGVTDSQGHGARTNGHTFMVDL